MCSVDFGHFVLTVGHLVLQARSEAIAIRRMTQTSVNIGRRSYVSPVGGLIAQGEHLTSNGCWQACPDGQLCVTIDGERWKQHTSLHAMRVRDFEDTIQEEHQGSSVNINQCPNAHPLVDWKAARHVSYV